MKRQRRKKNRVKSGLSRETKRYFECVDSLMWCHTDNSEKMLQCVVEVKLLSTCRQFPEVTENYGGQAADLNCLRVRSGCQIGATLAS